MKKRAPFQMRSGNRPSPAKLLGVLTGQKKFKDSKVGKAVNPEGKKFGETKVGKFLKGFGPRKAAKPTTSSEIKTPKTKIMHPSDAIGLSTPNKPKSTPTKPKSTKPKTTFKQAFDKMETVYGKTRMERYKKNPHTGELYSMSKGGLETFTSQAKSFNKKKGK